VTAPPEIDFILPEDVDVEGIIGFVIEELAYGDGVLYLSKKSFRTITRSNPYICQPSLVEPRSIINSLFPSWQDLGLHLLGYER
jgi:hypothetical protein